MAVSDPSPPILPAPSSTSAPGRNICLTLEYDGSQFFGWQRQAAVPTVQATLEDCLQRLTREKIVVHGSGRTDTGVHALGQRANFRTTSRMPLRAFQAGLNSLLPPSVVVVKAEEVPWAFHARYSARAKTYEYRILNRPYPSALQRRFCWWLPRPLDLPAMKEAAGLLIGTKDFAAFQASGSGVKTTVRQVFAASWEALDGGWLIFRITADGFLRGMVRAIVGTLVEIGLGKRSLAQLQQLFVTPKRPLAGPTAPAAGLYLLEVLY